jgi:nucleotide-binding universal stress UspA family protein
MKKLLIGYDGSTQANEALLDLAFAPPSGPVEALILSVADVFLPKAHEHASKTAREALAAAQRFSEEGARALRKLFPAWNISAEAVADSPGWGLIRRAESWGATLVAIGAHSQPLFDRYFFGSIAAEIIAESPCSVRICRQRPHAWKEKTLRVLVAVDGSRDSAGAMAEMSARLWPKGAAFRVLTALDSKIEDALAGGRFRESVHGHFSGVAENIAELAIRLAEGLRAQGLEADHLIVEGNPKSHILKAAEGWGADCIFCGRARAA